MFFASDNWAGVAPQITEALSLAGEQFAAAYGVSDIDLIVEEKFNEIFERPVDVFFVATGTAANSLSLSAMSRPGGVVLCHEEAHINVDECGAIEYLSGGSRIKGLPGDFCKLDPAIVQEALDQFDPNFVHSGQPMAISITQATEAGAVYSVSEVEQLAKLAKANGLPLHMDGARFANALVAQNVSAAEMSWKAGVDVMSFGATKNGCWCAEAIVVFNPELAEQMKWLRKRAGQLFSKTRFIAVQFEAYLKDNLWLDLARNANDMALAISKQIGTLNTCHVPASPEGNEVFAWLPNDKLTALREAGAAFYEWPQGTSDEAQELARRGLTLVRLVTSFANTQAHIDDFMGHLRT